MAKESQRRVTSGRREKMLQGSGSETAFFRSVSEIGQPYPRKGRGGEGRRRGKRNEHTGKIKNPQAQG